ncbi:MAG: polysaccharide deacetylase family protein [Planctomycetota bacterium]
MSWNRGIRELSGGLLRDWPFSLSCDDAPTIGAEGRLLTEDPARLDRLCDVLQAHGVRHCTAYVLGAHAEGQEDRLRRWLEAGYRLGNHTYSHRRASESTVDEFVADVHRCDELLQAVGAFADDRPRLFRFPSLDRGATVRERAAMADGVRSLGYTIAHATVDLFDYLFEEPIAAAERAGDLARLDTALQRYAEVALASCAYEARHVHRQLGRTVPLIAFFHCGPTSTIGLDRVLGQLRGVRWCSQVEALADPLYREFDASPQFNGRVSRAMLPRDLRERVFGRLASLSTWPGLFAQRRLGPLWPFMA